MEEKKQTKESKVKMPKLGWIPDIPDNRDYTYTAPLKLRGQLPSKVDLRKICPPVLRGCVKTNSC